MVYFWVHVFMYIQLGYIIAGCGNVFVMCFLLRKYLNGILFAFQIFFFLLLFDPKYIKDCSESLFCVWILIFEF